MSTEPPSGWIDPSGTLRPGFAPPGYWQASDGRWYPPQPAAAETVTFAGAGPPPSPPPRSRGMIVGLGVLGALAVLAIGGAVVLVSAADDEPGTSVDAGTSAPTRSDGTSASSSATGGQNDPLSDGGSTVTSDAGVITGDGAAVADEGQATTGSDGAQSVSCTQVDSETLQIDLVNGSSETSTFFLTIAFLDDAEQRLGDTSASISSLRPGERAIESTYVFDNAGSRCEVIDVDRYASVSEPDELADISACEITGTDTFGDVEVALSATNSGSVDSDYSVEVAIVDGQGIRRGSGYAYIEHVRPGETAPADIFTFAGSEPDFTCDVVYVDRTDST